MSRRIELAEGEGPLHAAARAADADEVRRLLAAGEDPELENFYCLTPLALACGLPETPERIATATALLCGEWEGQGGQCLALACEAGNTGTVQLLLDAGADPDDESADGYAPVYCAAASARNCARDGRGDRAAERRVQCLRLLLQRGADPDGAALHGPALGVAHSAEVVRLLAAHGADLESEDTDGKTPLMVNTLSAACAAMIALGADIGATDCQNNTPLHIAARYDQLDKFRALAAAGAGQHAVNLSGRTPLECAPVRQAAEYAAALSARRSGRHTKPALGAARVGPPAAAAD